MRFALPQLLWLLLLVPLLALFLLWAWRTKERLIAQFVQSRLLAQLTVGVSKTRQKVRLALLVSAVACSVLALARPQWGFTWEEVSQKGLDIVVAIDTSRSMLAADIAPNRLERAKLAAVELMKLAKNDRLGLVAFAGSSFLQCPLTLDEEAFRQGVAALDVNIIPQGGTAIAETIQTALAAFKDGDNHKILVFFTDGEDHEAGVLEAAQAASAKGLRIFTIGIGTATGELIRVADAKGKLDFLKDDGGNVVKSKLNETLLQQIAGAANGFYLNLRGANTMDVLYERGLAPLPKSEFNAKLMQRHHERFYWPLGIAIVLLVIEMFLPEQKKTGARTPTSAAALLYLLFSILSASASSATALKNYESGKFDAALKEYDRLRQQRPEDSRLAYNAGAAAYQARQFEDATRHFSSATGARDPHLAQSAFYNLGNAHFQLGDTAEQPPQKREAWEAAVNFYDTALKLRPDDADAQHNRDFVKRKLEELKQQQDKQQQQNKDDQKQDDKKDDEKKDPQKKDDKQQDKSGQDKNQDDKKSDEQKQQKPDGSKPDEKQPPKPDKPGDKQQPDQKKPDDQKGQQNQGKQGEQGGKDSAQSPSALGQMTQQQAQQLLDSQRSEERALIFLPTNATQKANNRVLKNW
ncbi:MAG: VWA domain-containing protein [Verrucomicrobia bacterium]|nr:VWA domain-containing protein [Verrucomicrobiota bacterium]